MSVKYTEDQLKNALNGFMNEANDFVKNPERLEKLIQQLEDKLRDIPGVGELLSDVAIMASLVRSYATNEYRDINNGTVIVAIACILYVVSPIDLLPDCIPGVGYVDDAALIVYVLKLIHDELAIYKQWRIDNGKEQIA